MLEELCGGYKEVYQYLLAWMADSLCNIGPCGIAVVLRGPERSGKTFWAKEYMSLFGVHAITLDGPQQLVGNFNYHLLYQMVVLADEAFFAGNRAHAAKLRTIITRDDQFVTPKGVDGFTAPKMWRLIIASNDRRVVHASATDRRFLVLQVDAGLRNQDQEYFGRIDEEMRCGGRRALFEWLTGAWWRARAEGFARMVRPTPSLTFRPRASLKFGTNTRPERIDAQAHTDAKRDVITAASARGVRFCGNVVLHGIARRRNSEERVKHGANTVLGAFNRFLQEANDHDLCCLDRLPIAHPDSYLRDKFQIGLTFPSGQRRALDRIMAFSTSCDGASHFASVADVVLGSFRYCANEPDRDAARRAMMPPPANRMWHRRRGNDVQVLERGLILRRQEVRWPPYKAEYDRLVRRLMDYLLPAGDLVPA